MFCGRFPKTSYFSGGCFHLNNIKAVRFYQSEAGCYGFKPKPKRIFKVPNEILNARNENSKLFRWVEAYRKYGHRLATIDPVQFKPGLKSLDVLSPEYYGLKTSDKFNLKGIVNSDKESLSVAEVDELLRKIYCGNISMEIEHLHSVEEQEWLSSKFEKLPQEKVTNELKKEINKLLIKAETWDNFLAKKFPTLKRYGGEGAESLLTFFKQILDDAVNDNTLKHLVLAVTHRGKGNLMTVLFNTRPAKYFRKFQGDTEFPPEMEVAEDPSIHFQVSDDIKVGNKSIGVSLLRSPSHLEIVNPVSMGKTRSKQQTVKDGAYGGKDGAQFSDIVLNIQAHGDAGFTGQGVNQECLMMTKVPNFEIGGTVHLITNNQVGFTTPSDRGRSTLYASDLGKFIEAPVFHVNGDDPEAVNLVTKLAFQYQRKFRKDIFIDLNCFRRWGHNELDDPTFTNPALYSIINNRKSVPKLYTEKLIKEGVITKEEAEKIREDYWKYLEEELKSTPSYKPEFLEFRKEWDKMKMAPRSITYWDTGLDTSLLHYIGKSSVVYPKDFNIHPHLLKVHVNGRLKKLEGGNKIDWSTAEALAMGSLMYQGSNVRISGEDVGRGTFSHRHVMLVDQKTDEMFIPLNEMKGGNGGKLEIANSILSEEAVLGYEYGMSIDNPNNLIIWEAQFGDFFNGAQIVIDTYIASGEERWLNCCGIVMLLPHGYDGIASDHSSSRIERFLQLTNSKEASPDGDNVNMHVINPTTPAQYYHALRRQILRNFRKPLVIIGPKILLRLPAAVSSFADMGPGTSFKNVIGDSVISNTDNIKKVIFCSGKHFYALNEQRLSRNALDTAIIRIESLCPFPVTEIQEELSKYKNAKVFVWSQEEPRNMGAWNFMKIRFENLAGTSLIYCGRNEAAAPATGIGKLHIQQTKYVAEHPFTI